MAEFVERDFWPALNRAFRRAGTSAVRPALELYYTARSPETPLSAKLQAGAALAYLILPLDLLPDVLAGVGYTDDVAALLATILALNAYISPAIREQAAAKAEALFGADVT